MIYVAIQCVLLSMEGERRVPREILISKRARARARAHVSPHPPRPALLPANRACKMKRDGINLSRFVISTFTADHNGK